MKKISWILIGIILVGLLIFKLKSNVDVTQQKVYHQDKLEKIPVQIDTLHAELIQDEQSFSGTFEANKETKLSAEIPGRITELFVDLGSHVRKGQRILTLDPSTWELQLQSIDVQIEGLTADVKRYTILTQADAIQGVQLEKSLLGLRAAKVQKATIQEQLNKCSIKAPFDGIITAKLSEVGSFVAPGIPIIQITDINQLKFTILVPEIDLATFVLHRAYSIQADAYPDSKFHATASLIGSKANMGSSFPVQFDLKNTADLRIKAGMFGKVKAGKIESQKAILIPSSSIMGSSLQAQVYVLENGKAQIKTIELGKKILEKTLVSKGLNENDLLITSGLINLFQGANVQVK
ncbi:MAG: efflux RND transporter periplasmic adaptor subunit [Bacteroidota bacterium]